MKKRVFAFVLAVVLCLQGMLVYASEGGTVIASGVCGENLTWVLDSHYVLSINGTGAMDNMNYDYIDPDTWEITEYRQPWLDYADKIVEVNMGNEITSIGWMAFEGFTMLKKVSLSSSLTAIGLKAFRDCSSLCEIVIPNTVTEIGERAFLKCSSLSEITIPRGVKKIGENILQDCFSLQNIFVEEGNEFYFDENGILFSTDGKKVILEKFPDKKEIQKYEFPHNVTGVNESAFEQCEFLTEVTISKSTTEGIGDYTGCSKLENIYVEEGNPSYADIDGVLFNLKSERVILEYFPTAKQVQDYEIPAGVTDVKSGAFADNVSIKSITFPLEINYVGYSILSDELKSIKLYFRGDMPETIGYFQEEMDEIRVYTPTNNTTWSKDAIVQAFGKNAIWSTKTYEKKNLGDCIESYYTVNGERVDSFLFDGEWIEDWEASLVIKDGFRNLWGHIIGYGESEHLGYNRMTVYINENSKYNSEYTGTAIIGKKTYASCGDNAFCTVDETGTVLTIWGEGEIEATNWDYIWQGVRSNIETVKIEEGITGIPQYAFYWMENLKEVDMADTVTYIGEAAFAFCNALETVKLSSSLTEIQKDAFKYCISLKEVELPKMLTVIGERAFYKCSSLEGTIVIPENITRIEAETFYDCNSIFEVIIPDGVTTIGAKAFYNCSTLYNMTLPNSITSIGNYAFANCYNWTNICLPNRIESIGHGAFSGCTGFYGEWNIPATLVSIGYGAFASSVWKIKVDENNPMYCAEENVLYNKSKTRLIVCSKEKTGEFVVAETVEEIDWGVFEGCYHLTRVVLSDKIQAIPAETFCGCTSLQTVYLPKNLKEIGHAAFVYTNITSIDLPEGLLRIDSEAFDYCDFTRITFPKSLEYIGSCAFFYCRSLSEIYFEGGAPEIESNAFEGVSAIAYYPASEDSWNENTLKNYKGTITWVPYGCAEGHTAEIKNVKATTCTEEGYTGDVVCTTCGEIIEQGEVIPKTGHSLNGEYFVEDSKKWNHCQECSNCNEKIYEQHVFVDEVCTHCGISELTIVASGKCGTNLTWTLDVGKTLRISGNGTMQHFTTATAVPWIGYKDAMISRVLIEEGVTSISQYAFVNCKKLVNAEIASSVTTVDSSAFQGCPLLESVWFRGSAPTFASNSFSSSNNVTAYYPENNSTWTTENMLNYGGTITWIPYSLCDWAGHGDSELKNAKEATCTEAGYTGDIICSTCEEILETGTNIPKLGHKSTYIDNGDGTHTRRCQRCTYVYTGSHSYNDGVCICQAKITDSVATGTCGTDVTWSLSGDGILTISGTGKMSNWDYVDETPWYSKRSKIKAIVITEGVTSVGKCAFGNCGNVTSVIIAESVSEIGAYAFTSCSQLIGLSLPSNLVSIGGYAFSYCQSLATIEISSGVTTIGQRAFEYCTSLQEVRFGWSAPTITNTSFYMSKNVTAYYPKANTAWTASKLQNYGGAITWVAYDICEEQGHKIAIKNVREASCTQNGYTGDEVCTVCGTILNSGEVIESTGHTEERVNAKEAICKEEGYTGDIICTVCGETIEHGTEIPKLGHHFDSWKVAQSATFEKQGIKERICDRCGEKETEIIPQLIAVASIEDKKYETISEAIADAKAGEETTITLLQDITESITIPEDKRIILDLNGFTLSNNEGQDTVTNKGELGVIDGGEVSIFAFFATTQVNTSIGKIVNDGKKTVAVKNEARGVLYLVSGVIENVAGDISVENAGTMEMLDGKVLGSIVSTSGATTNITGGSVQGQIYKAAIMEDGSYDILDNTDNSSTISISGGTFSENISGFNPDNTVVVEREDGLFEIQEVVKVTIQSKLEDGKDVSTITQGNGTYAPGETVSVVTEKKLGYEFLGWYALSADGTTHGGEVISKAYKYTFVVEENTNLVAVYKAVGTATLKVNGANFKVNGGITQMIYNYTQDFNMGTVITLTAIGENFAYWMNDSNKIVSADKDYVFTLFQPTVMTAVYKYAVSGEFAFVEFVSDYDQVLQAQNYGPTSEIVMPNGPSKSGYIFQKWNMTAEEIQTAIANGETYIRVAPVYEKIVEYFDVTVVYDGDSVNPTIYRDVKGYEFIQLDAKTIEGRKFAYWSDAAVDGNVLGTSATYSLYVNKDITVYAIYVNEDEVVVSNPTITMTNAYTSESNTGAKKLHFEATRSVPKGYVLQEHGVLYGTSTAFGESDAEDVMILGASGVSKNVSTNTAVAGVYVLNVSIGTKVDTIVYARGYMILLDEATGDTIYVYSQIMSGSYNSLNVG